MLAAGFLLLLTNCQYVAQMMEERRLDDLYDAYYAQVAQESAPLQALKKAAEQASAAQVSVMPVSVDTPKSSFPISGEEWNVTKAALLHLQDLPPLNRETWKKIKVREENGMMDFPASYSVYTDLELLDAQGKVIGTLSLTQGIAPAEKADYYRGSTSRIHQPSYMLPQAHLESLKSVSAMQRASDMK